MPVALGAAARLLEDHGLDCTVADARYAKPLDGELIARLVAEHDVLVTVEENVLAGASAPASSSSWPTAPSPAAPACCASACPTAT